MDNWRFWIIHLWVEGFFELFVTIMVAVLFYRLGMVTRLTATRVIYLDAILFLGSGIIGTGHHWYWTGQPTSPWPSRPCSPPWRSSRSRSSPSMPGTSSSFRGTCDICGKQISSPTGGPSTFLMAVGFWNFVGAGIFGFLINLPIVSYFEVGTILTPNHGHAAMMGVFGMFALSFMVFAMRQVLPDDQWLSHREIHADLFLGA